MIARLIRFSKREDTEKQEPDAAGKAGELFAGGMNCAQSVLRATTGCDDPRMMAMAKAFGGGIGGSRCLCGAISGGVMALGLEGREKLAARLIEAFKERYRVTCCSALSRPYTWMSREHRANCRSITEETAAMVEKLLRE